MGPTPEGHEDGEEHRRGIVKEIGESRKEARFRESLVAAGLIAKWTQSNVPRAIFIADLLAGRIVLRLQSGKSVNETERAHHGRIHEHLRVESQPAKIQGDLVAEVLAHQAQRLLLVPLGGMGPRLVEDPTVQRDSAGVRSIVPPLVQRETAQIGAVVHQPPNAAAVALVEGCPDEHLHHHQ